MSFRCSESSYHAVTSKTKSSGTSDIVQDDAKLILCFYSYEFDDLQDVQCNVNVEKTLPQCEHTARVQCHQDPKLVRCRSICGGLMTCCSRKCSSTCNECRTITAAAFTLNQLPSRITRTTHRNHPCERLLYCQHHCGRNCSQDHECNNNCSERCRQTCSHHTCEKPCSEPCPPCMEPCSWMCGHGNVCPVPCGSVRALVSLYMFLMPLLDMCKTTLQRTMPASFEMRAYVSFG